MSDIEDEAENAKPGKKPSKPSKPKISPLEKETLKCPQCDSIVEIYPSPEATYITVIAICITIILFNIWSVFLLPFIIPLSKAIVLHCSRCDAALETHQPFGLASLKDNVMSIGCGQCALVVSRTYLLSAVTIILCIFYLFWGGSIHHQTHYNYIESTWEEYLKDCGGEMLLKNHIRANQKFNDKYEGKTISWDGYLMRATESYGWFKGDHAVVILVKMQPSESDIHADLILSMDESDFLSSRAQLALLDRGSHFVFNATFMTLGNEDQLHHLHAHSIVKIQGSMEISPHVHSVNHRYNLKTQGGVIAGDSS